MRGYTTGALTSEELTRLVSNLAKKRDAWYIGGEPKFSITAQHGWAPSGIWVGFIVNFPRSLWNSFRQEVTDGDIMARLLQSDDEPDSSGTTS